MTPRKPLLSQDELDGIVAEVLNAGGEAERYTRDVAQSAAAIGARKMKERAARIVRSTRLDAAPWPPGYNQYEVRRQLAAKIEADGEEPKP